MSASKPTPGMLAHAPRRKPGRPFKHQSAKPSRTTTKKAQNPDKLPEQAPTLAQPPTISFRSFKAALSVFQHEGAVPAQLDISVWSHKLHGTNRGETLRAYRFLGLVDEALTPTPELKTLVAAYGKETWPEALQEMLERSYRPLLASKISTLTAGGLLRSIRTVYSTEGENTRKCCNFFIHAAREAALDAGPFLGANSRSRWAGGKSPAGGKSRTDTAAYAANTESDEEAVRILAGKLPAYETSWSDDVKRLWLGSFLELVQRLKN